MNLVKAYKDQLKQAVVEKWAEKSDIHQPLHMEKLEDMCGLIEAALYEENEVMKDEICQSFIGKYHSFEENICYIQLVEEAVVELFLQSNTHSVEEISIFLRENYKKVHDMERALIMNYERGLSSQINQQKRALKELSTPIIPVLEKIAILPLVGTIDEARAKLIVENVLEGIRMYRAEVLLVDITGVPFVDEVVAHYITQAVKAVHLLGTQCIIVGIQPEMAQAIASLNKMFHNLLTANTLQRGFAQALKLTNRKIDEV